MSAVPTPRRPTDHATDHEPRSEESVDRRVLLRGGALLAGAAGAAVVGAVARPTTAAAADGDVIRVGRASKVTETTTITAGYEFTPTLELVNKKGPGLHVGGLPRSFDGELSPGDLAGTDHGLLTGVNFGTGPRSDYLTTARELDAVPVATASDPHRALDTRTENGRDTILAASSSKAIDRQGRLTAGSWIDVAVAAYQAGVRIDAAFVNVTVVRPRAAGHVTLHRPGRRPLASTLNFQSGVTIANAAFVRVHADAGGDYYTVRIFTSQTTHVLLDVSGAVVSINPGGPEGGSTPAARRLRERQEKRVAALKRALDGS